MIKLPEDLNDKSFGFIADKFQCSPLQAQFILVGCNYTITEVQRLNATAQPVSDGWVKCSERMPESDGHYLVFANASTLDGYCDHNDIACYQQGKWSNEFNWLVTHWMPLPAAPGGQDD